MEEIDINAEIKRLESLYNHYKRLYHRVGFLCCSSETKSLKEQKKYYKKHLQEAKLAKEHCDALNKHLALTCPANKPLKVRVVNEVTSV